MASVRLYVAIQIERSNVRNRMAFVRHYVSTSIGDSNFRNPKAFDDTTLRLRSDAWLFETGWRSYNTTAPLPETRKRLYDTMPRRRSDAWLFETQRRPYDTTLWRLTLDISKPDGDRTTLQREVERALDFSKPENVRTTLRSLPSPFVIFAFFDVQVLKCCR